MAIDPVVAIQPTRDPGSMRRLAWGLVAAQVALVATASAYISTRPNAADAAGQRVCNLIVAQPFHPVTEVGAKAKQLRLDETRLRTSHHWAQVASDLRLVVRALDPQDRRLVAWDRPSPRMIQDCRQAM